MLYMKTQFVQCSKSLKANNSTWTFRCGKLVSIKKQKKARCNWKGSQRVGSFFGGTRLQLLVLWRMVIFILFNDPPRHSFLQRNLGVSYRTIVDWFSSVREVYSYHLYRTSEQIGGKGKVVDLLTIKFGNGSNRNRTVNRHWVLGAVERDSKKSFYFPVEEKARRTLIKMLRQWVLPGTTIITDSLKSYATLSSYRFEYLIVHHSKTVDDSMWKDIEYKIPKRGVKKKQYHGYLAEYIFKKKYTDQQRPHEFFCSAAKLFPAKY